MMKLLILLLAAAACFASIDIQIRQLNDLDERLGRMKRHHEPHPHEHDYDDDFIEHFGRNISYHRLKFTTFGIDKVELYVPKKGAAVPAVLAGASLHEMSMFQIRALKYWMASEFLKLYSKFTLPDNHELINKGKQTYNELKMDEYHEGSISGIIFDVPVTQLEQVLNIWEEKSLLSNEDKREYLAYLKSTTFQKVTRDSQFVRSDGAIVYGIVGYTTLSIKTGDTPKGAWVYAFHRLKFKQTPIVTKEYTTTCILWGIICETKFHVKVQERELTGEQAANLASYLRYKALDNYNQDQSAMIQRLQAEANQYRPFLPDEIKNNLNKINENPDKRPDQVVTTDPLDGNTFDL